MSAVRNRGRAAIERVLTLAPGLREPARRTRRWIRHRFPAPMEEAGLARMSRHRELAAFVRDVDAGLRSPLPGAFERCAAPFARLARGRFIQDFVDGELARIVAAPEQTSQRLRRQRGIPIVENDRFVLRIAFIAPAGPSASITSVARSLHIAALGRDPLSVERFQVPDRGRFDVFRGNDRLMMPERTTLERGMSIALVRRRHAYRILPPKGAPVLVLEVGLADTLVWQYDPSTLAPLRCAPTELSTTRLVETLRLISVWSDPSFLPLVEDLYAHPSHAVRWAALQTAWTIAPERALTLTVRATQDAHPDIRTVARTLAAAPDDAPAILRSGGAPWP